MTTRWQERYAEKLVSAEDAVRHIRPGDRVFVASACGEPQALVRALVQTSSRLSDTEVVQVLTLGVAPYADPKYATSFRANAFFIGESLRNAVNDARADYTPIFLSHVPGLFKTGRAAIDVALDHGQPARRARLLQPGRLRGHHQGGRRIGQTAGGSGQPHMPRALGDCFLHVNQINYLVEHDEPLLEWPVWASRTTSPSGSRKTSPASCPTARRCSWASAACRTPCCTCWTTRTTSGIHTEMFSDGVMRLARLGVITGRRKTLHRGKIVGSFAAGSQELFDFVQRQPADRNAPLRVHQLAVRDRSSTTT